MSVAYVDSQWTQPVSVADELESFFHVMLFYAVRFLPHNLRNTTQFVTHYFDTFQTDLLDPRYRQCSTTKRAAVMDGIIRADVGTIVFWKLDRKTKNPINRLISHLIDVFKARYAILDKASLLKQQASEGNPVSPGSIPKAPTPLQFRTLRLRSSRSSAQSHHIKPVAAEPSTSANTVLDTQKTAERLNDHEWVLALFESEAGGDSAGEWFDTGVVQDQLVNYEPRIVLQSPQLNARTTGGSGSHRTGEGSASKRPRKAGSNAIASTGSGFNFASTGTGSSFTSMETGPHFASTTESGKLPGTDSSSSGLPGDGQYRT